MRRLGVLRLLVSLILLGASPAAGLLGASPAAGLAGCAGGSGGSARSLPPYTGHAVQLFDDTIEPAAVGLDLDRSFQPRSDATLRERAQVSDAVLRVRIDTVTVREEGSKKSYELRLKSLEQVTGAHPPEPIFPVKIGEESQSIGIMNHFGAQLVGK